MTFDRLSGSLGSLLLIWARIERAAREEVVRTHGSLPKSAHGIAALLKCWEDTVIASLPPTSLCPPLASRLRAELQGPLAIRNGLCHGLIGILTAQGEEPAKLFWQINGKEHSISWQELQASFGWLSKIPRAFAIISNPSLKRIGSRGIDNFDNREWWLTEFALKLPER